VADPDVIERLLLQVAALGDRADALRDQVAALYAASADGRAVADAMGSTLALGDSVDDLRQRLARVLGPRRRGSRTVVIVDGDSGARRIAAGGLRAAGFAVRSFEALRHAADHLALEVPHAVVVDLAAGDPAHLFARFLAVSRRTARVWRLATTATVPPSHQARPFHAILPRPITGTDVAAVIQRLAAGPPQEASTV
jgi:hypothetical protein